MTNTEKELVSTYRAAHPRSRATRILVLALNTSARRQERCILCDAHGPTWCAKWPKTRAAEQWARDHRLSHLTERGES